MFVKVFFLISFSGHPIVSEIERHCMRFLIIGRLKVLKV